MSSEPLNIGDDDEPLWLGWYAGPGGMPRVNLVREGETVALSLTELNRLIHTAGVIRFVPSPYGRPGESEHECQHGTTCAGGDE